MASKKLKPPEVQPLPETLGECIDMAYKARTARLEYERAVEEEVSRLKAAEERINTHILEKFSKGDIEGAKGKLATASLNRVTVADVKDWTAFFKWVAKTDSWDMIQKRANDKAYRDRLEAKVKVPGVVPFSKTKLSLTKR